MIKWHFLIRKKNSSTNKKIFVKCKVQDAHFQDPYKYSVSPCRQALTGISHISQALQSSSSWQGPILVFTCPTAVFTLKGSYKITPFKNFKENFFNPTTSEEGKYHAYNKLIHSEGVIHCILFRFNLNNPAIFTLITFHNPWLPASHIKWCRAKLR